MLRAGLDFIFFVWLAQPSLRHRPMLMPPAMYYIHPALRSSFRVTPSAGAPKDRALNHQRRHGGPSGMWRTVLDGLPKVPDHFE